WQWGPLALAYTCACWAWLNTSAFGFTSFPLAYLLSRNRVLSPPPPSRPVLSSSSLRPHLKSKTPPLRAKIFFLPPPDLFFLDATLFESANTIAIQLLEPNN
ncbi:hypothetical protein LB506_002258, partial [Fusarium annulatum]